MSIKSEIRSGVFYTFIFKYANLGIQIIISAFLARLLTPAEFGVVAVINVFILLFLMISTFGFGTAVIQKQDITLFEIYSLFIFTILLALVSGLIFFAGGPLIANYFNNVEYIKISHLLAISLFFHTANMVPYHILLKERKFKQLGIANFIIAILAGALAIFLAFKNFSYYALVYQSVFSSLFNFLVYYKLSRIKIFKKFNFKIVHEIFNYSFFQFLYNFIDYVSKNIGTILMGKYLGDTQLGYYDRTTRLMSSVNSLTYVISPVLHPVLSRYQDDLGLIFDVFKKVTKLLAIIGFPLSIFLYFSAPELIRILYGNQWLKSIPVFEFLALTAGIQIILSSIISIFQTLGKTNYLFIYGLISAVLMISAITYGVFVLNSIVSVAIFLMISYFIIFFIAFYIVVVKLFSKKINDIMSAVKPGILIGIILIIVNLIIKYLFPVNNLILSFIIKGIVSGGFYIIMLYALKELKPMINLLKPKAA